MSTRQFRIRVGEDRGDVSAVLVRPRRASALLVLAHGAGAGITHPFFTAIAGRFARRGVATLRYQFPYMEAGRRAPDREPALAATVAAALDAGVRRTRGLPVFAGGKSMGGRITSQLLARAPRAGVQGLIFLGFPLYPAGKPSMTRAAHLADVSTPMLFVQGTRDRLADLRRMRRVVARLAPRATLHCVRDADHSFHVRKRSGRTDDDAMDEIADVGASWIHAALTR